MRLWDGQSDFVNFDAIRKRVQEANFAFKPAGVQFYIAKWERYTMPDFWRIDTDEAERTWAQVRGQLQLVFPSLQSNAFPEAKSLTEGNWLRAAAAVAARRSEILIWMPQYNLTGGYWGEVPRFGGPNALLGPEITWKFTHELGHVLGLAHTFDASSPNPITSAAGLKSDYWDLYYDPPNLTFVSSDAAQMYESELTLKNPPGQTDNCSTNANCTVTCTIAGSNYSTGSSMLVGLAFTFAGDNPGGGVFRRGFNAMGYFGNDCATIDGNGMGFSNSQVLQIRRTLRYDTWIIQNPGVADNSFTGGRPLLGNWHGNSTANSRISERLDLDGDSRRDIGIWQPPATPSSLGTFKFLLSGSGYSIGAAVTKPWGRMGDVPAMADYDGDGKTDIAVYGANGPTGSDPQATTAYWSVCTAVSGFSSCTSVQWGNRDDVPLIGTDFDGDNKADLAVYRPSDGNWYWRTFASSTPHIISGEGTWRSDRLIQLPGLYDNDAKTDLVFYDPMVGAFDMYLSSTNWTTRLYRPLPTSVIPQAGLGTAEGRGGAVVVTRAETTRMICSGPICYPARRAVPQVWEEYTGMWHTVWDPVNSAAVTSCQWGRALDTPLGGYIDRDADLASDYAIWRPLPNDNGAYLCILSAAPGTCAGSQYCAYITYLASPRTTVMSVPDMSGDQIDDVMLFNDTASTWHRIDSASYTDSGVLGFVRNFGDPGAVPL